MASSDLSRSPSPTITSTLTPPSTPPEAALSHVPLESPAGKLIDQSRWRPTYHLMPPSGWMNDPCAPGYDHKTDTYFVSFQWNPNGSDWGDICWGTAVSKDMVHWTVLEKPILSPDTPYDGEGVFTGCLIPSSKGENDELTVAYTSVSSLPIHHTLPHTRGSESLSLAKSSDSGKTWTKLSSNPVLPSEPISLDVTGWRDPFVARWPSMARTLGVDDDDTLFGIISGGIRDITPTTFVYAVDAKDFTKWRYIGPLVDVGLNKRLSRWSGDLGHNWEVTNFMTLTDQDDALVSREVLVMGTEGCIPTELAAPVRDNALTRPDRGQLWMSGKLQRTNTSTTGLEMTYDIGGHLDHGCLYAANSFFDPEAQKQVVWGWITEDDLCDDLRHKQGWSGLLSLPRELRLQTIQHVVRASASRLDDLTSFEKVRDDIGTFTMRTLGSEPLQRVQQALRTCPNVRRSHLDRLPLQRVRCSASLPAEAIRTDHWELRCSVRLSTRCRASGFFIGHSEDFSKATKLEFQPSTETFTITRPSFPRSDSAQLINNSPETAPHTLFTMRDPVSGLEASETLDIHVWRDGSVMEVFVNGRTAISTRLYAAEETYGILFFAEEDSYGADGASELIFATLWDGIGIV